MRETDLVLTAFIAHTPGNAQALIRTAIKQIAFIFDFEIRGVSFSECNVTDIIRELFYML